MKKLIIAALLGGLTSCAATSPAYAGNHLNTQPNYVPDNRDVDFFCVNAIYARSAANAMRDGDDAKLNRLIDAWEKGKGCSFFRAIFNGRPAHGDHKMIEPVFGTDLAIFLVVFPNDMAVYTVAPYKAGAAS